VALRKYLPWRFWGLFFLLILASVLTGCAGGGAPASSWFGLTTRNDLVYLAGNEQVYAVEIATGTQRWAFPPEPDRNVGPFYTTPAFLDSLVVVGGFNDNTIYALDAESGQERWRLKVDGGFVEGGVVDEAGNLYIGSSDGDLYAVSPEGQELWRFSTNQRIWATPLLADGRVYVASTDHYLYALDAAQGDLVWRFEAGGAMAGTPALLGDTLYIGSFDNRLYAISAETGEERWSIAVDNWVWGGPLATEEAIYFGDLGGNLYAVAPDDGRELWRISTGERGVRATPTLADHVLYVGNEDGTVLALDPATGTEQWRIKLEGQVLSPILRHQEVLLVSLLRSESKLVALKAENGQPLWRFPPPTEKK